LTHFENLATLSEDIRWKRFFLYSILNFDFLSCPKELISQKSGREREPMVSEKE